PGMSSVRVILPGQMYAPPPAQDKRDARKVSAQEIAAVFSAGRADKALSAAFFGLSPQMAAALCSLVTDKQDCQALFETEKQALGQTLYTFYQELDAGICHPSLALGEFGEPVGVYPFRPNLPDVQPMPTMREALDAFYESQDVQGRMQRHGAGVRRVLLNNIERCEKKLALYQDAIEGKESIERLRLYGELLTANLHTVAPGAREAAVMNYYVTPPAPVAIPLDPQYSPNENAQRYYKKYQKAKAARLISEERRGEVLEELAYLEGQLDNLEKCTEDGELLEISEELRQMGYIKARQSRRKPPKLPASKPLHFIASDGTDIFVGKNNRQNDTLTAKAAGEDTWLHTKDIPGSHVILKSAQPSREALYEACLLAAWYSKGRGSSNVPVDYTQRKHVKKPAGAKPGMVIYTTNKTAYITPEEREVKAIRQE
ncbi:MAG: fibronectin-binding domain-containing protein, partial [Clostridia bacterium]|nr:fibronectin-binding domain-containing protein [Clostridia bacterium]